VVLNSAVPAPGAPRGPQANVADEYTAFCDGVRRVCGIDLSQYKRNQMERRIRTFADRRGTPELNAYLLRLQADTEELDAFLDRVTINVSQLWRNPDQWERLERRVLPELAESRRIRAWSAGCSYGAEAYTLGALAKHVAPAARIEITGTDIDKRVVARAQRGVFTADDARDAPSALLSRFFEAQPDGAWAARPEIQALTRFEVADLLRIAPRTEQYDLVLCRNTVIYFTDEVRDALHAKLVASLRPGGYLVVGATERVANQRALDLVPAFPFTYRKAA
jgi:chemotaxis protein methyltransferase CheR